MSTTTPNVDPGTVMQMMQAAQVTALIRAGVELGVFAALAQGAQSGEEVARQIHCPSRSTQILLNAMAAIGLLQLDGTRYRASPLTESFLTPGKPVYMGDAIHIFGGQMLWERMGRLAEAVRKDGTVFEKHAETPEYDFW